MTQNVERKQGGEGKRSDLKLGNGIRNHFH